MSIFVFRNQTVEPLFSNLPNVTFSEYGSISVPEEKYSLFIWCYFITPGVDKNEILEEIEDIQTKLQLIARERSDVGFLIFTLDGRYLPSWQLSTTNIIKSINTFNNAIYELAGNSSQIKIINISDIFNQYKLESIIDKKYYYLSKIVINPQLTKVFQEWFGKVLKAIKGERKKCLVLDLDNTIWGGILGEDGITGIKLGNNYPGNCFVEFQKQLREAKRNGVLLAISSKNNEEDVWQAFEDHPDMILKKADFVAHRINWNNKAVNIREIAEELNIGIDSIVFIDDNPVERALVGQLEPEVTLADFPDRPYELIAFFQKVYQEYFLIYQLTAEDLVKTEQYKANSIRSQNSKGFESISDYLVSLNTIVSISKADTFNIPRIAQLTQKTNQFNLTTRRYTEHEVSDLNNNGNLIFCASVSDKFGDNGITVAGLIFVNANEAIIDNYLLSCRILGREIESTILKTILNYLFENGVRTIKAEYLPTMKNKQTEDFYDKLGFESRSVEGKGKKYSLEMNEPYVIDNLSTINLNFE
jgi:FkbH-like protein